MRELWPDKQQKKEYLDRIDREQQLYDDLVARINELQSNLDNYEDTTDAIIQAFASSFTTSLLNATNIYSESISADVANILRATFSEIISSKITKKVSKFTDFVIFLKFLLYYLCIFQNY